MTKQENKQRIKNEALNAIAKIYNPKYEFPYSNFPEDGNYTEQREYAIRRIIEKMNEELAKLENVEEKMFKIKTGKYKGRKVKGHFTSQNNVKTVFGSFYFEPETIVQI